METLITFKTAQLAKDKEFGFDFDGTQYVPGFYSEDGEDFEEFEMQQEDAGRLDYYIRPSQSVLSKWFIEKYNVFVHVYPIDDKNIIEWSYFLRDLSLKRAGYIESFKGFSINFLQSFSSFEEAMEGGLFEALSLITLKRYKH